MYFFLFLSREPDETQNDPGSISSSLNSLKLIHLFGCPTNLFLFRFEKKVELAQNVFLKFIRNVRSLKFGESVVCVIVFKFFLRANSNELMTPISYCTPFEMATILSVCK